MTEYFIPTGASETELVEKRSRFLGHVWPVESEGVQGNTAGFRMGGFA